MLKGPSAAFLLGLCLRLTTSQFLVDPDIVRGKGLSSDVFIVSNRANIRIHHDGDRYKIRRRSRDEVRPSLSMVGGRETGNGNQGFNESQTKLQTRLEQGDVTITRKENKLDLVQGTDLTSQQRKAQDDRGQHEPGPGNSGISISRPTSEVNLPDGVVVDVVQLKEQTVGGSDGRVDFIGQDGSGQDALNQGVAQNGFGQGSGQDNLNQGNAQNNFDQGNVQVEGQLPIDVETNGQIANDQLQTQNQVNSESGGAFTGSGGLDVTGEPNDGQFRTNDVLSSINPTDQTGLETTPVGQQEQINDQNQGQGSLGEFGGQGNEDQEQGEQRVTTTPSSDIQNPNLENTGNQNEEQQEVEDFGPTPPPGEQGPTTIQSQTAPVDLEQAGTTVPSVTDPGSEEGPTTPAGEQNQNVDTSQPLQTTEVSTAEGETTEKKRERNEETSAEQDNIKENGKKDQLKKIRDSRKNRYDRWWDSDSWEFDSWESDSWESKYRYRDRRRQGDTGETPVLKGMRSRHRDTTSSNYLSDSDTSESGYYVRRYKTSMLDKSNADVKNLKRRPKSSSVKSKESSSDSFWDSFEDSSDETYLYEASGSGKTKDKNKQDSFKGFEESDSSDSSSDQQIWIKRPVRNKITDNDNRFYRNKKYKSESGSWEIVHDDSDSWSDSWESSESGSAKLSRWIESSERSVKRRSKNSSLKESNKESRKKENTLSNDDEKYIYYNGGSSDFWESSDSNSWEYYYDYDDGKSNDHSRLSLKDVSNTISPKNTKRRFSDDSSDDRVGKHRRQRNLNLNKENSKNKSNEHHYEVSGRVLLKKADRRSYYISDDSDSSDSSNRFVRKRSRYQNKKPRVSVGKEKSRPFLLDTT